MSSRRTARWCACLVAVLGVCGTGFAQTTMIDRALRALEEAPPAAPDSFDFIVVADSNTLKPLEISDVYRQCIREFNILKPDFVVHSGDIILGGAAEGVPAQWDLFGETVAECELPYLPLPGNHDISDEATERIWLDRIGLTHYSFHHGNSLFVLLNSEENDSLERISDRQVSWLKEQLASTKAANIFVFLHEPFFAFREDPDDDAASWEKHWANVAEAFRGHPVRAVFAGHEHVYRDCGIRDGVRYVICGGASVYGMGGKPEEGSFNHYLWVRVRGEDVTWAVVKPYSVLPQDAVTSARIDELYNIRHKWIDAEELVVPIGEPLERDMKVTVRNPHDAPMKASLTWELKPGWAISPPQVEYAVPANGAADLRFRVVAESAGAVRFPVPVFHTQYTQTAHGPAVDVAQDLRLVPEIAAFRAKAPVALDGVLDEWAGAQMTPIVYPVHFDAKDTNDLESRLGFLWDESHLYLAVETQDNEFHQPYAGDIVWAADNVEMFLGDWSWGLTLTAEGSEAFLYWGVDVPAETVNTDVKLAVKRDGTKIIYEAAFPKSHLTPLELVPGGSFRYNVLMNDLDPSGPVKDRHWLELVPGPSTPDSRRPRVQVTLRD